VIVEYHRPESIEAALELLARHEPRTMPLAGGSALNRPSPDSIAVVDLQALGLNHLRPRGNFLEMGATLTLQALLDEAQLPTALQQAIRHEATQNLRLVATVAGTLVSAGGRSPFTTTMLALDAVLSLLPGDGPDRPQLVSLGDLLPVRAERLRGRLITQVSIPLNARLAYEYVARTPADQPIVCVAAAAWPSGRRRVALGGYGKAPFLAFDGTEDAGAEIAASDAYSQAGDEWAAADYRQEVARILAHRCISELNQGIGDKG
jgi:CO/xanthine dehydrogenase FAD-binding subunit